MVYRVELNLATHTLAMSEEQWNIGTLQRKRKPGKRGEVSSNISPIWQNQTSVLSNTHYDCGTKYNFRLFFTSDHPAFETGRGEIRALSNAKLAELANLFWQTTVQKVSPCRFLSRYCNYSLTLVRTHTWTGMSCASKSGEKMYARTNKWAQRTSCIYFMFTELYVAVVQGRAAIEGTTIVLLSLEMPYFWVMQAQSDKNVF